MATDLNFFYISDYNDVTSTLDYYYVPILMTSHFDKFITAARFIEAF